MSQKMAMEACISKDWAMSGFSKLAYCFNSCQRTGSPCAYWKPITDSVPGVEFCRIENCSVCWESAIAGNQRKTSLNPNRAQNLQSALKFSSARICANPLQKYSQEIKFNYNYFLLRIRFSQIFVLTIKGEILMFFIVFVLKHVVLHFEKKNCSSLRF